MVRTWFAALLAVLGIGYAQATTLYRIPIPYIPYPITAWFDHSSTIGVDIRYDGTNIPSYLSYYYDGHRGTDFGTPTGTPVYAAAAGTVIQVRADCPTNGYVGSSCGGGFGNHVAIRHADGMVSIYAHLSQYSIPSTVWVGASVTCASGFNGGGTTIGYSGNSGWSDGSHLHFELRANSMDPSNPSYDPFGGPYGPMYWRDWAYVYDPIRGIPTVMPYPVTICQ